MHLTEDTFLKAIPDIYRDRRLVVGLSGGLDSTVLLHLCVALKEQGIIRTLEAIHINHGLSPNAAAWQSFCESICYRWSVPMVSRQVTVQKGAGEGLEASARAARYQQYEDCLRSGDCLLQAHHLNDQAETLLYRIIRGCGVHGLAAIPRERTLGEAVILRPLLGVSREAIHAYAQKHDLEWVEDESNRDVTYDRNFLRHDVLPVVSRRWSGVLSNLGHLAEDAADVAELLDQVAEADMKQALSTKEMLYHSGQPVLDIGCINGLSDYRQRNLLRHWLRRQGFLLPGRAALQSILDELIAAAQDACPVVGWEGCEIRRHEGAIVAMQPLGQLQPYSCELVLAATGCIDLPGNGRVSVEPGRQGQTQAWLRSGVAGLSLGYRSGLQVASFRLPGRKGRKSLKKWLNELSVPAWVRDRLPILHRGGELVAIPGLLVNAEYAAAPDDPGVEYCWQSPFERQW